MRVQSYLGPAAVALAALACNLPGGPPPATATPLVLFTETATTAPLPTDTPLPTPTGTPLVPIARPAEVGVNCRVGPGIDWKDISYLLVGQTATIQGRNADSSWWYVVTQQDPGTPCWVAASVTVTAGNVAALPVIPKPQAVVTSVDLDLQPRNQSLPGCFGPPQPIEFDGTITTNGPTEVTWHFETEDGGSMPSHTLEFDQYGTKGVDDSFLPTDWPGQFWVRLVVTEPNGKEVEKRYKIEC